MNKTRVKSSARLSQFFLVAQKIKHESLGTTSITNPPILSGSKTKDFGEYCKEIELVKCLLILFENKTKKYLQDISLFFHLEKYFPL